MGFSVEVRKARFSDNNIDLAVSRNGHQWTVLSMGTEDIRPVIEALKGHLVEEGIELPPSTANVYRAWINQPSTSHPLHDFNGKNVIAAKYTGKTSAIWFLEGDTISMVVPSICLSKGWPKPFLGEQEADSVDDIDDTNTETDDGESGNIGDDIPRPSFLE